MSTEAPSPESSPLVRDTDDLIAYFHDAAKPKAAWKVGVEHETPAVETGTGEALPYDGESRSCIRAILAEIAERESSWTTVSESGRIIALRDANASITLEPGGQVEMSGRLCETLHCAQEEFLAHCQRLATVGESLGVSFLGLGATPKTSIDNCPWMPKQRYRIMRHIMKTTGTLGHRMMQQTATVQANFDYSSEADARRKLRASLALSPILVAIGANSPIVDSKYTGFKSFRAHIWTDTDPARCGPLPFAFDTAEIFSAYVDYALDVPMYFVIRNGKFLPTDGIAFRRYLTHGLLSHRATLGDWAIHLTTLFPQTRLKPYIEVRSADAQPQERGMAIPALLKGILYDDDCLDAAWDLLGRWSTADRLEATASASKEGLTARVRRHPLLAYSREILDIAVEGLTRQQQLDQAGRDEAVYLDQLSTDLAEGVSPADRILAEWNGPWRQNFAKLIEYCAYRC